MAYKNLCNKYNITEEEIKDAVDQINFGNIACDGVVLVALCHLITGGDIPEPEYQTAVHNNNVTTQPGV